MATRDPDALLTRAELAETLTSSGFPITPATLATMASRNSGPGYKLFGRTPVYRWGDALEWAVGRLTAPKRKVAA